MSLQLRGPSASAFAPRWQPNTAYAAGQAVLNPAGEIVTAKTAFTSAASYSASSWNLPRHGAGLLIGGGLTGAGDALIWHYPGTDSKLIQIQDELYVSKRFAVGGSPSPRLPFGCSLTIDGSTLSAVGAAGDKVGNQNSITFKGGFSGEVGYGASNPGFIWGANDFILSGSAAGDLAGISSFYGRLTEVHVRAPGAALTNAIGLAIDMAVESSAVGATVTDLYGLRVSAMADQLGSAVTNAYGVYVDPVGAAFDPLKKFSIFTAGSARASFGGSVDVSFGGAASTLHIYESEFRGKYATIGGAVVVTRNGSNLVSGAMLTVQSRGDSDVVTWFRGRGAQSGDIMRMGRDLAIGTRFDMRGRFIQANAVAAADADLANGELSMYVDGTAGAMKLMLKGKDNGGTIRTATVNLA